MHLAKIRLPAALVTLAFILLLICLTVSTVAAQFFAQAPFCPLPHKPSATIEREQKEDMTLGKDYFRGYVTDLEYIVTSPARWDRRDWLIASAVIVTVGGLLIFDQNISEWIQGRKSETTKELSKIGNKLGEGNYLLPGLAMFYAYGAIADDNRAKRTFLLGTESFLISGLFTTSLKYLTHRQRPADGNDPYHWHPPGLYTEDLSFCSGHSTAAFSVATVIATEYSEYRFVPPIAYGLAGLTALSRIHDGAHWASDVFLGSAIGYFTAKAVLSRHAKKDKIRIMPLMGSQTGLSVSMDF